MKLEEKEAEGEVAVTLLGETVDGRVRCVLFAKSGCWWWMSSFVFVKNVRALYFHQWSTHPFTSVHIMHPAKSALLKLISKSNFDLFVLTSRSAKRVWFFIFLCFARILIFVVFWIWILAYGYLHIDLKKWKKRSTETDHRNTRTTTVMIFILMIITTISTGQQGRRPDRRNTRIITVIIITIITMITNHNYHLREAVKELFFF